MKKSLNLYFNSRFVRIKLNCNKKFVVKNVALSYFSFKIYVKFSIKTFEFVRFFEISKTFIRFIIAFFIIERIRSTFEYFFAKLLNLLKFFANAYECIICFTLTKFQNCFIFFCSKFSNFFKTKIICFFIFVQRSSFNFERFIDNFSINL